MKHSLADIIAGLIGTESGARPRVGLLFQTRADVAEKVAATGHSTLIVGDRFGQLYRVYRRARRMERSKTAILEARLDSLPLKNECLDALVVLCRVPAESAVKRELPRFRRLLGENGLLIWPHPMTDGIIAKTVDALSPFGTKIFGRVSRPRLCAMAMESGFKDVGQVVVPAAVKPWVITTARAASRPFERPVVSLADDRRAPAVGA